MDDVREAAVARADADGLRLEQRFQSLYPAPFDSVGDWDGKRRELIAEAAAWLYRVGGLADAAVPGLTDRIYRHAEHARGVAAQWPDRLVEAKRQAKRRSALVRARYGLVPLVGAGLLLLYDATRWTAVGIVGWFYTVSMPIVIVRFVRVLRRDHWRLFASSEAVSPPAALMNTAPQARGITLDALRRSSTPMTVSQVRNRNAVDSAAIRTHLADLVAIGAVEALDGGRFQLIPGQAQRDESGSQPADRERAEPERAEAVTSNKAQRPELARAEHDAPEEAQRRREGRAALARQAREEPQPRDCEPDEAPPPEQEAQRSQWAPVAGEVTAVRTAAIKPRTQLPSELLRCIVAVETAEELRLVCSHTDAEDRGWLWLLRALHNLTNVLHARGDALHERIGNVAAHYASDFVTADDVFRSALSRRPHVEQMALEAVEAVTGDSMKFVLMGSPEDPDDFVLWWIVMAALVRGYYLASDDHQPVRGMLAEQVALIEEANY